MPTYPTGRNKVCGENKKKNIVIVSKSETLVNELYSEITLYE